ncbi:OPT oligopeptide transporter protein-domain-containing protein [Chytriomyces sp. MP71]|nr:OPT oligopeptide transporter protein-domain-containing protein [Chytriomyces sp. MP71]
MATPDHKRKDSINDSESLGSELEIKDDINDVLSRINFIAPQTDEPSTPAFTLRSVTIGTIFCILLSFANTALSFRSNAFSIGANIAVIVAYPIGLAWAALPKHRFFNPGPFTMKEHVIIFILASSGGVPYGIDNVVAQIMPNLMGNTSISFIQSLSFVLITQFLGYGLSGLTRRFLVKPTAMWWPSTLGPIALFSSFHSADNSSSTGTWTMSRFKFFWIAFIAMFVYTWIPEFLAPALQVVSLACVFSGRGNGPSGTLSSVNAVAGSATNGVGLMALTFDWNQIGSTFLTSPFWAICVNILGSAFMLYVMTPLMYATDAFGLNSVMSEDPVNHNPLINSAHLFVGNPNSSKPLGSRVKPTFFYNKSDNYNLNLTAYNDVAPVHITSLFALGYATSFLTITASISHVFLWYGSDIYRQAKNAFRQTKDEVDSLDRHARMNEVYPDVPDWMFLALLGVCTGGAVLVSVLTPFGMPWWGVFFNLVLCAIFILPFGIVQAISGFALGLNVLTEFVIGLMIPGQTIAVMAFKSWGTNNIIQALSLSSDMKLAHYLHIPPHAMVGSQFLGTLINAIVSTAAAYYMMFHSGNLLESPDWQYISYQVFYSAGGIWGAIGPQRFFGIGSLYQGLLWSFLVGTLAPFLPWLGHKYLMKSKYWEYVNFPLFFTFAGVVAFQTNVVIPLAVAAFAQLYLYARRREFYLRYVYVMGAAFDGSSAIVALLVSFVAVSGYTFNLWHPLNPNTANVPTDYYCYAGATFKDYDCAYYLAQGLNVTADGLSCKA